LRLARGRGVRAARRGSSGAPAHGRSIAPCAHRSQGHFRPRFYNPGPAGIQELRSGELIPTSLYEAQLCERLRGRRAFST